MPTPHRLTLIGLLSGLALLTSVSVGAANAGPDVTLSGSDPLMWLNRGAFQLNSWFSASVIQPLSEGIDQTVPEPLQRLAGNFFSNLTQPEAIVGHYLAGNMDAASEAARRFIINSTLGVGGMLDVASRLGIHTPHLPFGAAVCQAGLPTQPYAVLPLIGPSNLAVTGTTVTFLAGGFWILSRFSSTLAAADLVIDLSASAASLRHIGDLPTSGAEDPYRTQHRHYRSYLREACPRLNR